ncbi:MAG: RNA polymerase sigma factor [Deltaproteobacteria bacterium]|nr:RNA polymerase sigma factor [Deltaproteobacteria bacterium]MCW5807307.1 RNA polymerase sigma factor [Deltaproteobacteria bacterium]
MGAAVAAREQDLGLARRAAGGERVAQRELFQAHRANVHHTLFRILGSNRDLEDLVQDAFLEIFRALPSFRGDSTLARWCQTIATRTAYLAISRRKPPAIDLALVEDELPDGADTRRHVQVREAARRLYAALDRIEARQRIAFALAVIDGCSLADVAQLTDASIVAVKTRVWRARRELMKRAAKDDVLASYLEELGGRDA